MVVGADFARLVAVVTVDGFNVGRGGGGTVAVLEADFLGDDNAVAVAGGVLIRGEEGNLGGDIITGKLFDAVTLERMSSAAVDRLLDGCCRFGCC